MLTISPLENEAAMDADEHLNFMTFLLEVFGKTWENVITVFLYYVSTNKSIVTPQNLPLIGCANRRINVAVKDIFSDIGPILAKINSFMVRLKKPLQRENLQLHTAYLLKVHNATRWSFTFEMVLWYQQIVEMFPSMDSLCID